MAIEKNPFDHILYEFSMYLQASLIRCNDQFITNLLIDSRMVHTRNLAYFFCLNKKSKSYLHYSMYISKLLPQAIDHKLSKEIETVTSNSTCHLLKGRLKESFKKETYEFEQRILPLFVSLIKAFISELNKNVCPDYATAWADTQIQKNAADVLDLIQRYETAGVNNTVVVTTM